MRFEQSRAELVERIDAALPQTQCRRCGYAACRPYAEAMASRDAPINRCPPGGEATIAKLAAITGCTAEPLDAGCGEHMPFAVALIDEAACIGCTLCIRACPVDAIVGAPKLMHTVIESRCTGCELCLAPCPVDCIAMIDPGRGWSGDDAVLARARYAARNARHAAAASARATRSAASDVDEARTARRARMSEALDRARARRRV